MKKLFTILAVVLGLGVGNAYAQMTDDQVVEYTKTATAAGKTQNQIARELLAKGVTPEQAERIREKYEASQGLSSTANAADNMYERRKVNGNTLSNPVGRKDKNAKNSRNAQKSRNDRNDRNAKKDKNDKNAEKAPRDPRERGVVQEFAIPSLYTDEFGDFIDYRDTLEVEVEVEPEIFGHAIFNNPDLSFEPNLNAATPGNYILGPEDEIVIDIWGANETTIRRTISPEGRISIPQVGLVQLSGLTIAEASQKLRNVLSNIYSGLEGDSSSISVSLGNIRTIQVNVMGEVEVPGTYRLSSLSTVFHGIYNAGGITPVGSLRNIQLQRNGKKVASVDVYDYLFGGRTDVDVRLEEGDVIIVPAYSKLVTMEGNVKRPMIYEMADDETLMDALEYAGGFKGDAYKKDVNVIRETGGEKELYTVGEADFGSYVMADGDFVEVGASLERFSNMLEVRGYVYRPGQYQLGGDIATVRQLVTRAGGPTEEAFLNRAILLREKSDLGVETISVDLGGILNGTKEDVLLKKNDIIIVSGVHELYDRGTLTINGMVAEPGTFIFTDNTTIEDLILRAGGLLEGASTARVDVARRVDDPNSTHTTDTLGIAFSFPIRDGFAVDGGEDFILEPYDVVSVRQSPGFRTQSFVKISGAVAFPGEYLLVNKNETISDIIERAGGLTKQAYAKGARITRLNDEAGVFSIVDKVITKNSKRDSVDVKSLDIVSNYFVAVNLERALANPHSTADVQMVAGDEIYIPELDNTVRVIGEVMFSNAVVYEEGKRLKHYVNAAGGFSANAKRNKSYVIYANGSAARKGKKIEPGCIVIVPAKPEKEGLKLGEISAITSASTSILSLVTLLGNLFAK